ncbi:hypothetical protein TNCV_727551 [Trichonephila clavipes]|nr:hypothetical protein TNCV_727551 [Trichonephila clavipes]
MWKDEVGMSDDANVGNNRGNWRNSLKWCVDRIMVKVIIGVTTRISVKKINGSRAGNRFQNDDRRFNDRGYQFRNGGKMTILVEGPQK